MTERDPVGGAAPTPRTQEILIVRASGEPFEYRCRDCDQLRLWLRNPKEFDGCGNCGSGSVITGPPGSLEADDRDLSHDGLP